MQRYQDGEVDRQEDKEIRNRVHREEMGLLDLQDRERRESCAKQGHPAVIQTSGDNVNQQDRQQITEGGYLPPHQIHLVVASLANPFGNVTHYDDRQIAVYEKAITAILRIKR